MSIHPINCETSVKCIKAKVDYEVMERSINYLWRSYQNDDFKEKITKEREEFEKTLKKSNRHLLERGWVESCLRQNEKKKQLKLNTTILYVFSNSYQELKEVSDKYNKENVNPKSTDELNSNNKNKNPNINEKVIATYLKECVGS